MLVISLAASVLVHSLAGLLLGTALPRMELLPDSDPLLLVDFDIHEAPLPPEAEMPADEMEPVAMADSEPASPESGTDDHLDGDHR